jgi:sigma-B regulation protein RsbU (phosphoserine phosphatase)
MHTDGITEAFDEQRRAFGEQRLIALVERIGLGGNVESLGTAILGEVARFAGAAPQSDDIAVLIVERA